MKKFRGMLYFLAGVVFTVAVTFGFFSGQNVRAYDGGSSCFQRDMTVVSFTGVATDPKVMVYYQVPSCFAGYSLSAGSVQLQGGKVAVEYRKP